MNSVNQGWFGALNNWLQQSDPSRARVVAWGIFVLALIARLIFVFTLQDGYYFADGKEYVQAAHYLTANGEFSPEFGRAPLYPVFLSLIYGVVGDEFISVRLVQATLGAGVAAIVALIGFRIGGLLVGALAGLLWAIYPMGVFVSGIFYPTVLLAALLSCAVFCLVIDPGEERYAVRVFLAGMLLGLSALAKPIVVGTVIFVCLWLAYEFRERWKTLLGMFLLGVLLLQVPWLTRNAMLHDRLVLVESRSIDRLVPWAPANKGLKPATETPQTDKQQEKATPGTQAERATPIQNPKPEPREKSAPSPRLNTPDVSRADSLRARPAQAATAAQPEQLSEYEVYWRSFLHMAQRYPREFASFFELYPRRVGYLKQSERDRALKKNPNLVRYTIFGSDLVKVVSVFSVGSLYLFALIGIFAMLKDQQSRRALRLLALMILSFAMGYAISWGKIRYRVPVDPFIIIFSAWGLAYLYTQFVAPKLGESKGTAPEGQNIPPDLGLGADK